MQSQNSRYIGSSGFETIRKKYRYFLRMRGASCSSADKRLNLRSQFIADQKATCSLWSSESLMTCKCQCVYVIFLHINVNGSCCLCSVQNKKKSMFFAEISDFLCRHDSSAYIGSMKTDHKLSLRTKECGRFIKQKTAVRSARDPVKRNSMFFQLYKRTHHCIMLHGSYKYMIAGFQKSFQKNIQTGSDIFCKNNILTLSGSKVKELQKLFSCLKNLLLHRISCPVSSPIHIHSRACQVIINCLCHRWCFWKRRTGLIQIDFIHK